MTCNNVTISNKWLTNLKDILILSPVPILHNVSEASLCYIAYTSTFEYAGAVTA